ncbi:MAG: hypothetical protein ABSA64_09635 [Sedimentisphaerales bacterium]|jgi:hypothetical protein
MNEEKLKQILNKIGQADVPPNATLIAERASRNFDSALKIAQPKQWFFTPLRLLAAAAVIILVFAAGRWSKPFPPTSSLPEVASYAQPVSAYPAVGKNPDSFWQQKALAAMQPKPYSQNELSQTALLNVYKQYLKEKHYD